MIQINPLKSYIDGGVRAALTTPPSASLVFDLPGKAIWVKGVKLKGTDHTYTFSHDNYITLTNTPDSNESEDIKIGVNTSALKSAIDTTYGVVSTTANGLAPKFTSGNKLAAAAATTYYFLGWAGSTLKWYQAPFRNIRINSETTDCLGVNNTDPLIISSGNGISVTWDSTNKKIIITNTKPDINHNTDTKVALSVTTLNKNYAIILKGNDSDEGSITTVNFSTYLKFNPSTKQLTINGSKVITTVDTFVGATTSADGSVGLVTKPLIANRLLFLRGDGTWATPINTWRPVKVEGTEKLGSNALDLSAGNGISIIYNSDTKKIIITNTKPDVNHNTHYTTMLYIGENNDTKANKNIANPYLKLFDDNARRATFQIKAGNGIAVASDANGNITITNSSPDVNHNTDISVKQTPKTDNINRPIMMINGSTSTGEQINTSMFSTGIYANASTKMITANGFIKAGSSDSYVLLGGGNHKAISDFATSGHNHDGRYLYWAGNAANAVAMGWGTLTAANGYTILSHAASSDGGDVGFTSKGGQIFMLLDGYFYLKEGRYRVLDTSDFTAFSNAGSLTTRITIGGVTKDLKIDADTIDGCHELDFFRIRDGVSSNSNANTISLLGGFLNATGNGSGNSNYPETYSDFFNFPIYYHTLFSCRTNFYWRTLNSNPAGTTWRTLLDSYNYASYLDNRYYTETESDNRFVNVTGDTMTGTLTMSATNKIYFPNDGNYTHFFTGGTSDSFSIGYGRIQGYSNIYINADTDGSTTEYILMTAGRGISNTTSHGLKIGYNTLTWLDNIIWHAGNDGSGSGLDADLLDGYHYNQLPYIQRLNWWNEGDSHNANDLLSGITFAYSTHSNCPTTGTIVAFSCINSIGYPLQLQGKYYGEELWFRNRNGDNGTWQTWRYVIHNGNIGSQSVNYANSAGQLSTTRYIYGNTFNGTQNITGNLTLSTGDQINFQDPNNDGVAFNYNNNKSSPSSIRIYNGRMSEIARFTTSGNFGIGIASPSYKLHVAGDIYTTTGFKKNGSSDSYVLLGGGGHKTESSLSVNYAASAGSARTSTSASFLIGSDKRSDNESPAYYMSKMGYCAGLCTEFSGLGSGLIGVNGYTLLLTAEPWGDSSGGNPMLVALGPYGMALRTPNGSSSWNAWPSGNIYAGNFYTASDIRFKKIINYLEVSVDSLSLIPIFNFKWTDSNDILEHSGTSAQEVEKILPNIVTKSERLTVDYATLGTIAGITACKELVILKSEIKQLKEKVKLLEDKLHKYENTL